ncbi:hypothetical protein FB45DRAFT_750822 [Roridomyces roridus]|uniref:Uncharacterized protein n=1 Tax=Roridomyces roridus TaxID=1738132 RepID=A0AAD7FI89_9AGAR|nr:hypothetical protein FB45DRAFT_750822 [Roridomyces roridus]
MKFTSTFFATTAAFVASVLASASATPLTRTTRTVFTPPVTYPHAGTVWFSGQTHNVTWDTSEAPSQITNKLGRILLRKDGVTTPLILAENFDILLGRIEVKVPLVVEGSDYQLNLFGDWGDFSPEFTIQGYGI